MNLKPISVFAINLKSRIDRRKFILSQFVDREEFQFSVIEAYEHQIGAQGLWLTIRHILKTIVHSKDDYIILCQDDHLFTREYSKEHLLHCINKARTLNADILSCGISGFTSAIKVSDNLYWVEKFSGLQFTVVFRKFFQKILETDFETVSAADLKLCELTENKFFIYPFLSIQKEFGYSDVTAGNNIHGHVDNAFKDCNEKVTIINTVSTFYKQKLTATAALKSFTGIESVVIPFYIIHLNETTENLSATENQFEGRHEFAITIIEGCQQRGQEFSLWISLKKIIKTAIENDDEVIIICREGHQFTEHYERNHFVTLIWQAGVLGCNILISGMAAFNLALPITDNIFWIDSFHSSHFFVIYKSFYSDILQETFCDSDTLESKFSEMTSNKMTLHPFISEQKDFGDTERDDKNNFQNIVVLNSTNANQRLIEIKNAWNKFGNHVGAQL
jgi:GR25 family glycosyltransferase involved in LPS biosynthesis